MAYSSCGLNAMTRAKMGVQEMHNKKNSSLEQNIAYLQFSMQILKMTAKQGDPFNYFIVPPLC